MPQGTPAVGGVDASGTTDCHVRRSGQPTSAFDQGRRLQEQGLSSSNLDAMKRRARSTRFVLIAVCASFVLIAPLARADEPPDDYSNPEYVAFDIDNMARTTQRQRYHVTTPAYGVASAQTFSETWVRGVQRQARDLPEGRVYAGLGQLLPGGNVGDPERYHEGDRVPVEYENRQGARVVANVWPCTSGGACPGVVITTGSIQVTQHMYGWLARHLQANGYTVFTHDVRGQGESETTTHPEGSPFPQPANPQEERNFVDSTVDALRVFLDPAAPWADRVDEHHVALVGHSLGARAVSVVQQCSNRHGGPVAPLPAACDGETWPIEAIVAYDGLSSDVRPVVPALDHRADGYFINAVPTPTAPDPDGRVAGAYATWRKAGVDACTITGRGFTHAEWSEIPYIVSATRYGVPQAAYYTLAWLDRFVAPGAAADGHRALVAGPVPGPAEPAGAHAPWRASLFSGKYRSACFVSAPPGAGQLPPGHDPDRQRGRRPRGFPHRGDVLRAFDAPDLRAYAGVAAVGDWRALNREREGV
jgi:hypothetical protein